uniref:Isoleucine--tRNA ligase n=1 Tax=Heterorhabditis bacteriophora TaxID=37862 RepID=A0A1I7XDQ3_HETBA
MVVAWTTTPWTLPSNLALCVHPDLYYISMQKYFGGFFPKLNHKIVKERGAFRILCNSFVTTDQGTGVVHQAPYFGENTIIAKDMKIVCPVDESGKYCDIFSTISYKKMLISICRFLANMVRMLFVFILSIHLSSEERIFDLVIACLLISDNCKVKMFLIKGEFGPEQQIHAIVALGRVLILIVRLMAPFAPFFCEFIWQNLKKFEILLYIVISIKVIFSFLKAEPNFRLLGMRLKGDQKCVMLWLVTDDSFNGITVSHGEKSVRIHLKTDTAELSSYRDLLYEVLFCFMLLYYKATKGYFYVLLAPIIFGPIISTLLSPYIHNNTVHGFVETKFNQVLDSFSFISHMIRANFGEGLEREGAAVAVYYRGKRVVHLWGGYADKEAGRLWMSSTRTVLFSATKVKKYSFRGLEAGDFDVNDRQRSGTPRTAKTGPLEALWNDNVSQKQGKLAEQLAVDKTTVSRRLHEMGKIREEKWIMYDNPKHIHSWVDPGQPTTSMPKPKKSLCASSGT